MHLPPATRRLAALLLGSLALGVAAWGFTARAPALQAAGEAVRLDDFTRTYAPGELYDSWELQKIAPLFGSGEDTFFQFVHGSGPDGHVIHLRSGRNNSFSLGRKDDFQLSEWPMLEWEWKVLQTPKDGDVRVKALDDQAGSMCVIVNPGLIGFDSMCYLWENDGPKDTPITSTKRDGSRYLILRTAKADGVGNWYQERRNMLEDYVRVFGRQPQHEAVLGMQIDSDSTSSSGEVHFRNLYRRKR